ncbi:MAG: hypothetical protein DMG57_25475 [Acidobacteria bacterium]|nr:MAG: hypothetical protein DMG57_25475 [Acidobacteriota bacterium]
MSSLRFDSSNVSRTVVADQYVRLISASVGSDPPLLSHCAPPAPLALPDSFQSAPACARTEALLGRSPPLIKSLIAARPIATVLEKTLW